MCRSYFDAWWTSSTRRCRSQWSARMRRRRRPRRRRVIISNPCRSLSLTAPLDRRNQEKNMKLPRILQVNLIIGNIHIFEFRLWHILYTKTSVESLIICKLFIVNDWICVTEFFSRKRKHEDHPDKDSGLGSSSGTIRIQDSDTGTLSSRQGRIQKPSVLDKVGYRNPQF